MKQELFEKEYGEQTLSLKNEGKSIRQIIVCLKGEDINFHNVRNYLLKQVDSQKEEVDNTIQELNENVLRKTSYQLIDDVFIMQYGDVDIKTGEKVYKEFTIPLDLVSKIAYSYSIHGENLSGTKILQKYQLKRDVWMLLKTRLHLTKDENAIPDVILDYIDKHHGEKAVEDKIIEATYSSIESKHINKYKTTYDEILKDEAKKAIHILSQHNNYLEHLQQFIENYKQIEIPTINNTKEYTNDRVQIGFADLHIGKMNTDEVINRIIKLTKYLINRPEKNIDLLFLGDLYEMLAVGGGHPGQIETMDGTFGFELLLAGCSVIEDMITKLYSAGKNITFNGVAGNHDIVSTGEKRDVKKMGGLIAFELMKRKLSNLKIEFNYFKEQINKLILGNTCYIISHGENGISSKADKRPEDLLWKYGDQTRNNVIMYGHLHNVNIKETKDATVIGLPGLAGVGQYDKDLGLMSDTGVIVVNENEDKRIDVLIKRL